MYLQLAETGGRRMKIKILKPIPVQQQYRPTVGKVYEVLENEPKKHLAHIDVDGGP